MAEDEDHREITRSGKKGKRNLSRLNVGGDSYLTSTPSVGSIMLLHEEEKFPDHNDDQGYPVSSSMMKSQNVYRLKTKERRRVTRERELIREGSTQMMPRTMSTRPPLNHPMLEI